MNVTSDRSLAPCLSLTSLFLLLLLLRVTYHRVFFYFILHTCVLIIYYYLLTYFKLFTYLLNYLHSFLSEVRRYRQSGR